MYIKSIIFVALFVSLFCPAGIVFGDAFDPWFFQNPESVTGENFKASGLSPAAAAFIRTVRFFQENISEVDGDRCMMHPSCSSYGILAVQKHGFIAGWIMTVDRIIHENNEMDTADIMGSGDEARFHDSVENNDFWWYKGSNL